MAEHRRKHASTKSSNKKPAPKKSSRKRTSIWRRLALYACVAAVFLSLWNIAAPWFEYEAGVREYDKLSADAEDMPIYAQPPEDLGDYLDIYEQPVTGEYAMEPGAGAYDTSGDSDVQYASGDPLFAFGLGRGQAVDGTVIRGVNIDAQALKKQNADFAGFIYIPNTPIKYPIVRGKNNAYYLNRTFAGSTNASGALFMDYRNAADFSSQNTIVFGHNMRNGSMFGSLKWFASKAFFKANKYIYVVTVSGVKIYEIYAFYTCTTNNIAYTLNFPKSADFANYLTKTKMQSAYVGASVDNASHVLTLSTCVNGNRRNILQAKLIPTISG